MEHMPARQRKGLRILSKINDIAKAGRGAYLVNSQTSDRQYQVRVTPLDVWSCTCPDFMYRLYRADDKRCKHIHSCIALREAIDAKSMIKKEQRATVCVRCDSTSLTKNGFRAVKDGKRQRYACKKCGYKFTLPEPGFAKTSKSPHVITEALDLFFSDGMSCRKIARHFATRRISISHVAIIQWSRKFMGLVRDYVSTLMPELGDVLSVDEMVLNIRNVKKREKGFYGWLWGSVDPKTRFVLATEVSRRRGTADAQKVMQRSAGATGSPISYVVTDSLAAYDEAIRRELGDGVAHVKTMSIEDGFENRPIERYWNEFREIIKTKRGLDNERSASDFADFYRIFHNHVRPHSGLDGMTPAEAAGLYENLGPDRLAGLIRLAEEHKRSGIRRLGPKRLEHVEVSYEGDSVRVSPRGWIDRKVWREINDILRLDGFGWITNSKDSCWMKMGR